VPAPGRPPSPIIRLDPPIRQPDGTPARHGTRHPPPRSGSRAPGEPSLTSCDAGSGSASGASFAPPCDDLYRGDDWPCVLLNGRLVSCLGQTSCRPLSGGVWKPGIITDGPGPLKVILERIAHHGQMARAIGQSGAGIGGVYVKAEAPPLPGPRDCPGVATAGRPGTERTLAPGIARNGPPPRPSPSARPLRHPEPTPIGRGGVGPTAGSSPLAVSGPRPGGAPAIPFLARSHGQDPPSRGPPGPSRIAPAAAHSRRKRGPGQQPGDLFLDEIEFFLRLNIIYLKEDYTIT
jgi:hypothetical protein